MDQPQTKKCPYCAEEIKKDAKVCRFCLRALEDDNYSPIRLEFTSKKFKKHMAISVVLIILGFLFLFSGCTKSLSTNGIKGGAQSGIGLISFLVGIIWGIVTKIRLWWHRG